MPVTSGALAGMAGGWLVGALIGTLLGPVGTFMGALLGAGGVALATGMGRRLKSTAGSGSLCAHEATIRGRLAELDETIERLATVRARVEAEESEPDWARLLGTLRESEANYARHRERYRLKLLEIDLVRWLNALEAATTDTGPLNYRASEQRLKVLDELEARGETLRGQLKEGFATGPDETAVSRERVDGALEACEEVRRALIARQAQSVLRRVGQSADRGVVNDAPARVPSQLEILQARAELGLFEEGVRSLEADHARLQAELDVNVLRQGVSG